MCAETGSIDASKRAQTALERTVTIVAEHAWTELVTGLIIASIEAGSVLTGVSIEKPNGWQVDDSAYVW